MGYFDTLAAAERWAESVRRHYPSAFATIAPMGLLRPANSGASDPAPVNDQSLTDSQVLRVLETRRASTAQDNADRNYEQIALLRPEDTGTRLALREAVVQGRSVTFAVQLHWSTQPIDLSRVRSLAIFKAYTLYAIESRRKGRSSHFLRLGFFADPISAKQVAVQVRSTFASAAVVPVVEPEITRAREAGVGNSAIPYLGEQQADREFDPQAMPGSSTRSKPLRDVSRHVVGGARRVHETPESLGEREMWIEPDSLSESGVRHLRVEVQEQLSGRWKVVRLRSTPADTVQVYS